MQHEKFMQRCLELARGGEGFVAPNPLVGAVLVHNGKIISEGFHRKFGEAHAEVEALKGIKDKTFLAESTLYVNLEPCSHQGKTPPCAAMLIEKGVGKVVIANTDPNPLVNGNGIKLLRKAGVEVITGILENEALELNKRFFTFHTAGRPYILLKWAQSPDGFVAPATDSGKITWISNKSSRLLVHKWRGEEQAILVGRNTVETDNPQLTTRYFNKKNPVRLIIDPNLKLKNDLKVFNDTAPVKVFNKLKNDTNANITFVKIKGGSRFLNDVMKYLVSENIQSVMVEGGAETLKTFIEAGLWDEARVFTGTTMLHQGVKSPVFNFVPVQVLNSDGDALAVYRNKSAIRI